MECFTPYNNREADVPCRECEAQPGTTCHTPVGYAHPTRMEDGLRARKAGR